MKVKLKRQDIAHLKRRTVVVAQLVERSLPAPESGGSNPVIDQNLY